MSMNKKSKNVWRKHKIQKKQANQNKLTLEKEPSKAKSDSENDWEIEEDSEATSDQGSEAAENYQLPGLML